MVIFKDSFSQHRRNLIYRLLILLEDFDDDLFVLMFEQRF